MDDRELAQRLDSIEKMLVYLVKSVEDTIDEDEDYLENEENEPKQKKEEGNNVRAKFQEE